VQQNRAIFLDFKFYNHTMLRGFSNRGNK
jgi:hypothetical protein